MVEMEASGRDDIVQSVSPQPLRTVKVQRRVGPVFHNVVALGEKAGAPVVDIDGVGFRIAALARALNSGCRGTRFIASASLYTCSLLGVKLMCFNGSSDTS